VATPHDRYERRSRRRERCPLRVSAVAVAALLLVAILHALPAFLDGLALLARPEPGLAGIRIGVLGVLRLLSHFDLRSVVLRTVAAVPVRRHAHTPTADSESPRELDGLAARRASPAPGSSGIGSEDSS